LNGRSTGAFRRRGRGRRRFLDIALGAGRAAPIDAADHCLVVLGRHVEHLQFLEVLLGDRPALAPEESFHQRMADDPDEAAHQAEAFLKHKPLSVYYDEVAIKWLALPQLDVIGAHSITPTE
jgi:hypothetical protein